ncbi:MAG: single-stranded DNA-binding protein [Desulfurellales bacterium]|nr:MAG: single-stranded DNA-binding protein [Desulfurellales bacterium]
MVSEITIILGNVGRDAEVRQMGSGDVVANFSVAVSRGRDQQGNERPAKWYNVSAWGKLAEVCGQYVRKGMKVQVQGVVNARAYTNEQNKAVASLDLVANRVEFASRAPGDEGRQGGDPGIDYDDGYSTPARDMDDIPF